jgi:hypothetical protein
MKQYKIIKATYPKLIGVIFEYAILKDMQPPKWFQEFEKRNNARFDRLQTDVADLKNRMTRVENVLKRNNLS